MIRLCLGVHGKSCEKVAQANSMLCYTCEIDHRHACSKAQGAGEVKISGFRWQSVEKDGEVA